MIDASESIFTSLRVAMSIPKFTNPYVLAASTQPCSRADIFDDSDSPKAFEKDVGFDEGLKWLEDCLRGSFVYDVQRREEKGEDAKERPRKRRKNNDEAKDGHEESSVFEYRLLSSDKQPREINVQPKPPKSIRVIEPEYEDSPKRAELREHRAREVAVDFDWIMEQSRLSFPASRANKKNQNVITLFVPSSSLLLKSKPNIFLTERLKVEMETEKSTSLAYSSTYGKHAKSSPHELKKRLCCPLLSVDPVQPELEGQRKTKRKRGAPPPRRQRLQASS
ncbi:hypothetical protein ACEPAG_7417 [Sanghuangporus baumii]